MSATAIAPNSCPIVALGMQKRINGETVDQTGK
jgi:hypothetical protein